ncbi:MAG: DNA methyltransferase [Chloroflexota bacterium]|nr:DNA methyltransferase [Chloroflexota bacterium]MCY3582944.1 DNA methyltransferase [Chloroflexota bacterium]MDE2649689.1 DNA methyltransferase [Chloroflexota bacterium]
MHEEWTDSIQDDWPAVWEVIDMANRTWHPKRVQLKSGDYAYRSGMGAFLCWLGVRLMEMRRVLREDGSIYLHIDHTAHAYVKCLMDAIFGWKNFRNEIVWCYTGPSNTKRWFPRKHDTILFYTKSEKWFFNSDAVRIPYKQLNIQHRQVGGGGIGGKLTPDNVDRYRRKGKMPEDYWLEDRDGMTPVGRLKNERTGYPTQKPLALYRRVIEASSNEGDLVLDPFCGCATTPVAAEQLKRRWVGMDIWDGAKKAVQERLRDEWLLEKDASSKMMFPHEVFILTEPPVRTDDNEVAAKKLNLKIQRAQEPWQRITHRGMMNILSAAQASSGGVICAGCGRVLEREFMQLDHITPKSGRGENHIMNRILLCGPCNRRKGDTLTMPGLLKENRKKAVGWMKDESLAKLAQEAARERADWVRDNFDSEECRALIAG